MNIMDMKDNPENDNFGSYHALLIAFKTMKERCQQLQTRLAAVEEENLCLRLECGNDRSTAIVKVNSNDKAVIQTLQEKVENLKKQKSQLTHHVFMVAAENRHLWNRLIRLSKANKSLEMHFTKISDALKQHPSTQPFDIMSHSFYNIPSPIKQETNKCILGIDNGDKEQSLEEISLKLINSIMLEKSDLEQQYAEMVELQNNADLNLQNIGFTYPEDSDTDSLEQLKQHDVRLSQTKDALLAQQNRLKRAIQNMKKIKRGGMCNGCRKNANKKVVHIGIQFNSGDIFQEHGSTQTSLPPISLSLEKCAAENSDTNDKICPLCGSFYGKSIPFAEFHEHVLSHFTKDTSVDGFELIH
ncbi:protein spindle-F isoform X2 [Vespula maculifrons]|uniref:Protein spindle-F isoform X2 n=1 Tax=Vespula maculifrons TaxID=7453 RepID=A0ABD2BCL6_VESMC